MRKSPDELTSKALEEDLVQTGLRQAALVNEVVFRIQRKDEESLKLDRFMNEGAGSARERVFYEVYKVGRPVAAMELIRKLKIPRETVYYTLRKLTREGWLEEIVGSTHSRWRLA